MKGAKMINWKLAFLISGAGYGINILVLVIISVIIRFASLVIQKQNQKDQT